MDLMCPHCQRRVTVSDGLAGQVASCPLCAKQFMAPALPPASAPVKPPAPPLPPVDSYAMEPAPTAPPVLSAPSVPPPQSAPPPPPPPPGEFTRSLRFSLCPNWLAFVPSACVGAIFFLSFFSWHHGNNLYGLSFTTEAGNNAHLLFYTILTFLCLLAVVPVLLFDKGWIFTPPQLVPLMPWKNLALGCILGFCFLLLCFDYARSHFVSGPNPIELAMKIAFRLQLLAALASFGMFWLHWRKRKNLPLPKIELRW